MNNKLTGSLILLLLLSCPVLSVAQEQVLITEEHAKDIDSLLLSYGKANAQQRRKINIELMALATDLVDYPTSIKGMSQMRVKVTMTIIDRFRRYRLSIKEAIDDQDVRGAWRYAKTALVDIEKFAGWGNPDKMLSLSTLLLDQYIAQQRPLLEKQPLFLAYRELDVDSDKQIPVDIKRLDDENIVVLFADLDSNMLDTKTVKLPNPPTPTVSPSPNTSVAAAVATIQSKPPQTQAESTPPVETGSTAFATLARSGQPLGQEAGVAQHLLMEQEIQTPLEGGSTHHQGGANSEATAEEPKACDQSMTIEYANYYGYISTPDFVASIANKLKKAHQTKLVFLFECDSKLRRAGQKQDFIKSVTIQAKGCGAKNNEIELFHQSTPGNIVRKYKFDGSGNLTCLNL